MCHRLHFSSLYCRRKITGNVWGVRAIYLFFFLFLEFLSYTCSTALCNEYEKKIFLDYIIHNGTIITLQRCISFYCFDFSCSLLHDICIKGDMRGTSIIILLYLYVSFRFFSFPFRFQKIYVVFLFLHVPKLENKENRKKFINCRLYPIFLLPSHPPICIQAQTHKIYHCHLHTNYKL